MATVVLRPSSTTSQTGWAADPIGTAADNNTVTGVAQSSVTCNWTAVLDDLDSGLSGATINSFTISANGKAGRAGASTCALSLVHSSDGAFASENESWTGTQNTQTTSARTTQQDGSSALTYAYINNCSVKIVPNTQGITLYELFVTVDYTPAGYGNTVNGVASANISKINGVATANISKVNGV
jgi:hypothetical protein